MIDFQKETGRITRGEKKLKDGGATPEYVADWLAKQYLDMAGTLVVERDHYYANVLTQNKNYNRLALSYTELENSYEPLKRERDELLADVRSQGILTAIEK